MLIVDDLVRRRPALIRGWMSFSATSGLHHAYQRAA
jgi:hypothetical protein